MSLVGRISKRIAKWDGTGEAVPSDECLPCSNYRKTYYKCFTIASIGLMLVLLFIYALGGREIIWMVDGLEQYLPFFIYEGQWLRHIFEALISGQGFDPQLWTWTLGFGTDTLATIDVFWNPVNLIAVFFPVRFAEFGLCLTVLIRMWLAGLFFSAYCLLRKRGRFATLCGALVYSFCLPALVGVFWPAGLDAIVLFPLLLIGVEKFFETKNPLVYIIAVFLFFLVSYYYSYAACIFLLPYCIVRLFQRAREEGKQVTVRSFFSWAGAFLACLIIGVCMAAVALVPNIMQLLQTSRATSGYTDIPLLYSLKYYVSTLFGFVGWAQSGSDCYIGFGGGAFLACVLLFLQKKQHTALKITFIVLSVMLLIPFFGSLFNGFNYATNRWNWAYAFCVAYVVVMMIPCLMALSKREQKGLVVATICYGVLLFLIASSRSEAQMAAFALLVGVLAVVLALPKLPRFSAKCALLSIVAASLMVNAFYFAHGAGGYINTSLPIASGGTKLTVASPNYPLTQVNDDSFWRYDADPSQTGSFNTAWTRTRNDSLVLDLQGIDFYTSFYNQNIDNYFTELGLCNEGYTISYANLGGRSMLDVLANVKYYLTPDSSAVSPAYNYDNENRIVAQGETDGLALSVYQGEKTLPLGYTYDKVISRSTYNQLSMLQKQEALMQGAVVEDEVAQEGSLNALSATDLSLSETTCPSSIVSTSGVTVEGNTFVVGAAGASVTLSCEGLPNAETYFVFNNLQFSSLSPSQMVSEEAKAEMSWYSKASLLLKDFNYTTPTYSSISVQADHGSANRIIGNFTSASHLYGGKSNWALNMGYSEQAQTSVTLTFSQPGVYSFDSFEVVAQPMDSYNSQVDALGSETLQNVEKSTNGIKGTISLSSSKRLYFSIPYSEGWSAWVDGEKVDLDLTNTAFMSLELGEGEHEVQLSFMTPGLKTGALISVLGLAAFVVVMVVRRTSLKRKS